MSTHPSVRRFPTKVDAWLAIVLTLALLGPTTVVVATGGGPADLVAGLILLATGVFVAAVAVPTRYDVHPDRLVIRSGLVRWIVPLGAIESIRPSRSVLSGPAWSLDRLEVRARHGRGVRGILISPRDPDGFLRAVAACESALVPRDGGLRRSAER